MESPPKIDSVLRRYDYLRGQRDSAKSQVSELKGKVKGLKRRLLLLARAQVLAQKVAQETQEELQFRIADLVTSALHTVFPDPYDFVVRFEQRRGRTEAAMLLERNGMEIDPCDAAGGGVVDVVAFALRLCLWKLKVRQSRATMILDEPFRHVSRDLQPRIGRLLHEVSEKLGVQMVLVSHEEELADHADRVFEVRIRNGRSSVEALDPSGRNL